MTNIKRALSVRQPWAYAIIHGRKDIENRTWRTSFRGRVWIHASAGLTRGEYDLVASWLVCNMDVAPPPFEYIHRGGIIGSVEIVDCVRESESKWFERGMDGYGWVLRNPRHHPFVPCRGALGFWQVSETLQLEDAA